MSEQLTRHRAPASRTEVNISIPSSPVVTSAPPSKTRRITRNNAIVLLLIILIFSGWCFYQVQYGWYRQRLQYFEKQTKEQVSQLITQISAEVEKEYLLMQKLTEQEEKAMLLRQKQKLAEIDDDTPPPPTPEDKETAVAPQQRQVNKDTLINEPESETNTQVEEAQTQAQQPEAPGGKKKPKHKSIDDDEDPYDIDDSHTTAHGGSGSNVIPIVIFTYNRDHYLKRCLDVLIRYMPKSGYKIFISQDGDDPGVHKTAESYVQTYGNDRVVHLVRDRSLIQYPQKLEGGKSYYAISQHYKWAFQQIFGSREGFSRIIVLEEDLEIGPDFFDYFTSLSHLLDVDETLFCISAWNDNGMKGYVKDPTQLYRSDFFPGLGWMMTRKFWDEVQPKWPLGFWDDWLRLPENRKGRSCIRPEVSRTFTFGEQGSSGGQFYQQYLSRIELVQVPINWHKIDVMYLLKSNYDPAFQKTVSAAKQISMSEVPQHEFKDMDVKIVYNSQPEFIGLATHFGVMGDFKSGVPRTAYQGIVTFRKNSLRIFLVPSRPDLLYSNN